MAPTTANPPSSPAKTCVETALSAVPVPQKLLDGIVVAKVNTNGKIHLRHLTLSEDKFTIFITSSKVKNGIAGGTTTLFKPILRRVRSRGSTDENEEADSERAIDIGSVDRIQRGQNTLRFEIARRRSDDSLRSPKGKKDSLRLDSSRSFSVMFRGERTLDLMTQPEDDRDEILDALDNLIRAYQAAKVKAGNDVLLLRYIWLDVDKDNSNTVDVEELGKVLNRINFYVTKKELHERYTKFARAIGLNKDNRRKGLTFSQCVMFLHKVKRDIWQVKPVNAIWNEVFGEYRSTGEIRTKVAAETFLNKFLHKKQGQHDATIDFVRKLFRRLNQLEIANVASNLSDGVDHYIDKNHFEAYLSSKENDVFDRQKERFKRRSMNRPISHYWINSSHNTYLKGDQLQSHSTVEMYMNALYRGCRCVEIDIWDGGDASDPIPTPIVYHGHTMTTKIPFIDIIKSIRVFLNFNPDTYPIILSLENHCSIPYQRVMAEQLSEILGSNLFIPDDNIFSLDRDLPSPESLKGMVLIKGRRLTESEEEFDFDVMDPDDIDDEQSMRSEYTVQKKVYVKTAPQLARLTLFHSTNFKNWEESFSNPTHYMHSFSETNVAKKCKKNQGAQWVKYNQIHMSRTYPSGTRLDSSNYNPVQAWSVGCQLVALNFQTPDAPLRINDGRFRENGGCGYVLKPEEMLQNDDEEDDDDDYSPGPLHLSVRVLSGSCLPKPKGQKRGECIDPYVKVALFDVSATDEGKAIMEAHTTHFVSCNGFFPIWKNEEFQFSVQNQSVAILQLTVWDKDVGKTDDFIASTAIPISCLRKGYRNVQLFDSNNTRSGAFDFASLLIEVYFERTLLEI